MLVDLAVNPFDAEVADMVDVAVVAEQAGCSAVWVADHFTGAVVDKRWSRDPFVALAAIAARTTDLDVGLLVANVVNRHPVALAAAVNSLQSLAPGRVRLGVGSGAAPGSRFAVEHEAIGRTLGDVDARRRRLVDSIGALHAIWAGETSFVAPDVGFDGLDPMTDGRPMPPVVVGASAWPTIEIALAHADGVNLRATSRLVGHLERLRERRRPGFEVSVLDTIGTDVDRDRLGSLGCDRLVLGVSAPFDHELVVATFG